MKASVSLSGAEHSHRAQHRVAICWGSRPLGKDDPVLPGATVSPPVNRGWL